MPRKTKKSRKTTSRKNSAAIASTRKEYNKLTRAYHAIGKKALGKPKKSQVQKDYQLVKKERTRVGRRLGIMTGAHKGR